MHAQADRQTDITMNTDYKLSHWYLGAEGHTVRPILYWKIRSYYVSHDRRRRVHALASTRYANRDEQVTDIQ